MQIDEVETRVHLCESCSNEIMGTLQHTLPMLLLFKKLAATIKTVKSMSKEDTMEFSTIA